MTGKSVIIISVSYSSSTTIFSQLLGNENIRKKLARFATFAKKKDSSEKSLNDQFPLSLSKRLLAQSVVGVLGLGFIDAG